MRLRRRAVQEEPPPERVSVEEPDPLLPPVERRPGAPGVPRPGLRSAAERAAARRRLDGLAEDF